MAASPCDAGCRISDEPSQAPGVGCDAAAAYAGREPGTLCSQSLWSFSGCTACFTLLGVGDLSGDFRGAFEFESGLCSILDPDSETGNHFKGMGAGLKVFEDMTNLRYFADERLRPPGFVFLEMVGVHNLPQTSNHIHPMSNHQFSSVRFDLAVAAIQWPRIPGICPLKCCIPGFIGHRSPVFSSRVSSRRSRSPTRARRPHPNPQAGPMTPTARQPRTSLRSTLHVPAVSFRQGQAALLLSIEYTRMNWAG